MKSRVAGDTHGWATLMARASQKQDLAQKCTMKERNQECGFVKGMQKFAAKEHLHPRLDRTARLFIFPVAQVFGLNESGAIEFNDVECSNNYAGESGGCFHNVGTGTVTDGTIMEENVASKGGCICECHATSPGSVGSEKCRVGRGYNLPSVE